jgi:hypothetical protein
MSDRHDIDNTASSHPPSFTPRPGARHRGCRRSRRPARVRPTIHVDDCTCSAYRVTYDQRRAHTAVTHPEWTPGHSHNDALRVASKAILRDLWREARRIHLGEDD